MSEVQLSLLFAGTPEDNRNESYRLLLESGKHDSQLWIVFGYILSHDDGVTNQEIERDLHLRISSVTARVNKLRTIDFEPGEYLVVFAGSAQNHITNRQNAIWKVNPLWKARYKNGQWW